MQLSEEKEETAAAEGEEEEREAADALGRAHEEEVFGYQRPKRRARAQSIKIDGLKGGESGGGVESAVLEHEVHAH